MRLVILGAGGYGKTIADVAEQLNIYDEIVFLDDGDNSYLPCSAYVNYKSDCIYPAFGNNKIRLAWIDKLMLAGIQVPSFVHPTAYVSPTVSLGFGCVILPMAVVNTNTLVEKGCIINCGAIVDHDCLLEPGVHVCIHASVKANNKIASCVKIEAGCIVENGSWKR